MCIGLRRTQLRRRGLFPNHFGIFLFTVIIDRFHQESDGGRICEEGFNAIFVPLSMHAPWRQINIRTTARTLRNNLSCIASYTSNDAAIIDLETDCSFGLILRVQILTMIKREGVKLYRYC